MRYKGEVIETQQGGIAVKFSWRNRERIEWVDNYHFKGNGKRLVGQKGWMQYVVYPSGGLWTFDAFKGD